jgi:hypothetical protein
MRAFVAGRLRDDLHRWYLEGDKTRIFYEEMSGNGSLIVFWLHPQENHHSNQGQEHDNHCDNDPCVTKEVHRVVPFNYRLREMSASDTPVWKVRFVAGLFNRYVFYPPFLPEARVR